MRQRDREAPWSIRDVLDFDVRKCRQDLDERYGVLEEVLAGKTPAIVYPAARLGRVVARRLLDRGARIVAFGDGSPELQGNCIEGLPVLSPELIGMDHRSTPVLLSSTLYDSVIREDLQRRGCRAVIPVAYLNQRLPDVFGSREYDGAAAAITAPENREKIEAVFARIVDAESRRVFTSKLAYYLSLEKTWLEEIRTENTIYFDRSVYTLGRAETVVDGGAFVGDTLDAFLLATGGAFREYVAFEPDQGNFEKLNRVAARDPSRIRTVRAGLFSRAGTLRFNSMSGYDARVLDDGEPGGEPIPVLSLDEYMKGHPPPTLIKMDIEGTEGEAIQGAAGVIASSRPRLAMSVYHRPADHWELPYQIASISDNYRFQFRHYTREIDDTVCYALAD
jgi:FkbM family methyltransferase